MITKNVGFGIITNNVGLGGPASVIGSNRSQNSLGATEAIKSMFAPYPPKMKFVQADCPPRALRRRGKLQRLTARRKLHCLHGGYRCRRRFCAKVKTRPCDAPAFFGPSLHGENIWVKQAAYMPWGINLHAQMPFLFGRGCTVRTYCFLASGAPFEFWLLLLPITHAGPHKITLGCV